MAEQADPSLPGSLSGHSERVIRVAVGVVVRSQPPLSVQGTATDCAAVSEVLLAQRRADAVLGSMWEFPGGKVETGETVAACIERELHEETGLHVAVTAPLLSLCHNYDHGRVHLTAMLCRALPDSSAPRALEAEQIRWVRVPMLRDYAMPAANAPLIAYLQESL